MRAGALTIVAVLGLSGLSGCYLGPDPIQFAALAVVDGKPTAFVAVCGRSTVDVEVYRNDKDDYTNTLLTWSVTVAPPDRARSVDVELLGAVRPGWRLTTVRHTVDEGQPGSFEVIPLTAFEPGHRYALDSSDPGPEGSSAPTVLFTVDDLTKVPDGQVLVPEDHDHSKLMTREAFARDRCGAG
ncbi:hypothetical protein GCM10010170_005970 [Dactylosporangium salmoneum]|uniref:DUF2771 family protein n=1 Tax=Dactylosporangium salmoneum TaxID=53361 RepID=A0ABN3FEX1_9ACTN